MFSFLLGVDPGMKFLDHMGTRFNVLRNCQAVFYSDFTIAYPQLATCRDALFSGDCILGKETHLPK